MDIGWIRRRLFSVDPDGCNNFVLYLLGFRLRLKRRKPLRPPASVWKRFEHVPIKNNRLVIRSILKGYSCNAKYICEEILRQKLPYEIIWIVEREGLAYLRDMPPAIKLVMDGTDDAYNAYASCKVSVDTVHRNMQDGYKKKKGQYHIATWHGEPIKKISNHEHGSTCMSVIDQWRRDKPDYLIADSEREGRILRNVFANQGKLCVWGYPRNDIFARDDLENVKKKVFTTIHVPRGKKLLLYAPTWRDNKKFDWMTLDYDQCINACSDRWGGDWSCAVRQHHMVYHMSKCVESRQEIVDLTDYPDMQELLVAADVLITDYSSCFIDFMHTGKPSFLYIPDEEEYNRARGLYYPMESMNFPIARENSMLGENIRKFDVELHQERVTTFLSEIGCKFDGLSSKRVVQLIKILMCK